MDLPDRNFLRNFSGHACNLWKKSLKERYDEENVDTILIDQNPLFSDIRVAIRSDIKNINDDNSLYHESVTLELTDEVKVRTFDGLEEYHKSQWSRFAK